MARKRGGIAGFYDKNKKWLKTAAPALLSFVPGIGIPLSIAAGAAMGADREGRKYFGDGGPDVFGAIRGGLEGYGIGKGTQALAGGVKGLLAPKAPDISGAMNRASGMIDQANMSLGAAPPSGGAPGGVDLSGFERRLGALEQGRGAAGTAAPMTFRQALKQPQVLSGIAQGALGQLPSAQSAALNAQTELAKQQFEESKKQTEREERRRQLMAELLMPYASQNFGQYFGGGR